MNQTHSEHREPAVVVGGGLSGLAAALGLAQRGRAVTILEAGEKMGGAAAYSGGQVWAGANHVAEREGIEGDTKELAEKYIRAIAHRNPEFLDEAAMKRWIDTAPDAIRYWEEVGAIKWAVIPGLADYFNASDGARPAGRYLTNVPFLMDRNLIFVGSPETVTRRIREASTEGLFNTMMCEFNVGNLPEEDLMRSIRLFGTQVAPALRSFSLY